ncbi:MAG: dephospho-CoA kinase [Bacteroidales bacterium]|nr:dephospho-CoA kinase [Bacteroidales bacterium]
MKTILLTGGIGSGKSAVARILEGRGIPVYDSDSAAKSLYTPAFLSLMEKEFGMSFVNASGSLDKKKLSDFIFSDTSARERLEKLLYPALREHFFAWREEHSCAQYVVLESAIAQSKPSFGYFWDAVVLVDASPQTRLSRVMKRGGASREEALARMASQEKPGKADVTILNDGTFKELERAVEDVFFSENAYICKLLKDTSMKTDLAKTLSVRGQHGLFNYIAQSRTGAIVEAFEDKKRYNFSANAGITTLEDISIYTSEGEMKLREVFGKLHEVLGDKDAPDAKKAGAEELKALFAKAVPEYDGDRFYVSHMKKVVEWYNALRKYASLDFVTDEDREKEQES